MTFLNPQKIHTHSFQDKLQNQNASYEKRECPGGRVYFVGTLRECSCGAQRFKAEGLRSVEVKP